MERYSSKSGKQSGVSGYEIHPDHMLVEFNHGPVYKYSYASCGKVHVDNMQMLALAQAGLSTYISQHHPDYEGKD